MFDWIWNGILSALLKLIWWVFIQGPLYLISAFNIVLEYLTGGILNDLLFGSEKEFHWDKIPMQFWWFVIVAIGMFALIFTIQMIILIFKEASETKTKFVLAIQNAIKGFALIFLIPVFFFIANFIVQSLANTVINNFGNGDNIANYLWHIGDPTWDGSGNGVPGDYGPPSNLSDYNMIAQIFGTWFMLFAIFVIGIILVQKIIELFFLFIISPIVMVVMVTDDGKAAFTWKDLVIAKFLASTATLIGYYIFISVVQILLKSDMSGLKTDGFAKQLFLILFLCGGGLATIGFCNMIASFIGEGVGISEAKDSFRSTLGVGMMALGAGKMSFKALKFGAGAAKKVAGGTSKIARGPSKLPSERDSHDDSGEKEPLDFNGFQKATNSMASRTGIVGLAGTALNSFGHSLGKTSMKTINAFTKKNKKTEKRSMNLTGANATTSNSIKNIPTTKNKVKIPSSVSLRNQRRFLENRIYSQTKKIEKKERKNLSPKEQHLTKMNKKLQKYQDKRSRLDGGSDKAQKLKKDKDFYNV